MKHKITSQHTYTFSQTGESVTAYMSNTKAGFYFGLAFNHKGEDIHWRNHYEGILQLRSKVDSLIWYIWLTQYWYGGHTEIPTERVMIVMDPNAPIKC